jgi:colicin import membrane protein
MMSSTVPYSVPQEPGRWLAITLAVIVHAILFAFLWIGINWVNNKPETIEAEVWSTQQLEKAPPPVQHPEPAPEVKPPPEVKETPAVEKPDIALEQEKKRLEKEKKKREEEQLAKQEEADKKLADAKKKEADDKKKLADEKRAQDKLDAKKLAQQREAEVKRITGEATKFDATGTAARSQGNQSNSTWVARVTAKVKSNIVGVSIPPSSDGNNPAEFVVGLLPDGSVAGIRETKSSGIPAFDDAVRRAIEASAPYPADSSGRVPSSFTSTNKPKDQ